ncbi:unnamed protein product [Lathyrus oleraceus]|uniref:Kinetochore protein SPC25 n=1 Tax=Pisum sativum TaxID=3888 RepID=A0A9D4X9T3_PEA|nr:kinetochore protein SPC25 homolog [Pisum sativum]KAI5417056.1 hypothetical protein KIW84_041880 [Pisum sativum]
MECSTSNSTQQMRKLDAITVSLSESFQSLKITAQRNSRKQDLLEETKATLKEVEDELVKVLAEKIRKEAKRMALMDAIASAKARVGNLNSSVQELRVRKKEYASFLSHQSLALAASEGMLNGSIDHTDDTRQAISWYNNVLGFHVKGGHGVKFTFTNIDLKNPNGEYSFTVYHDKNTYILLSCEPFLDGMEELVHELNKTNELFKFVRLVRSKFQKTLGQGSSVRATVEPEESAFISSSAPGASCRSDSTTTENEHQVEFSDGSALLKRKNTRTRKNLALLSPDSASSVRQSPRLKVRK